MGPVKLDPHSSKGHAMAAGMDSCYSLSPITSCAVLRGYTMQAWIPLCLLDSESEPSPKHPSPFPLSVPQALPGRNTLALDVSPGNREKQKNE